MTGSRLLRRLAVEAFAPVDLARAGPVDRLSWEKADSYLVLFFGNIWHLSFLKITNIQSQYASKIALKVTYLFFGQITYVISCLIL